MRPDRVSNPGPLALESDALPTALRGPEVHQNGHNCIENCHFGRKIFGFVVAKLQIYDLLI